MLYILQYIVYENWSFIACNVLHWADLSLSELLNEAVLRRNKLGGMKKKPILFLFDWNEFYIQSIKFQQHEKGPAWTLGRYIWRKYNQCTVFLKFDYFNFDPNQPVYATDLSYVEGHPGVGLNIDVRHIFHIFQLCDPQIVVMLAAKNNHFYCTSCIPTDSSPLIMTWICNCIYFTQKFFALQHACTLKHHIFYSNTHVRLSDSKIFRNLLAYRSSGTVKRFSSHLTKKKSVVPTIITKNTRAYGLQYTAF